MSASVHLTTAADYLREAAGHVVTCADGARRSYGDTPLDDPVLGFTAVWTAGLVAASDLVGQFATYTAGVEAGTS